MDNKLQELTDKLYNEGLSKGKQAGDSLLAKAKEEAARIVADANAQSEKILSQANKEAEDLKFKVTNDLKMASTQTISALKSQIEQVITAKVVGADTKAAMGDASFVKGLIETVVKSFNAGSATPVALEVTLPEAMKSQFESYLKNGISSELSKGVNFTFTKNISGGFTVSPKDGGYFISFAEGDFEKLFSEYLRPATKKILFSE
ncbi:MAG: hypothetical protein IJS02_03035 [Bacteroidales bacterium]|nr:hypothetical protein [Bacteroidales bacterium]